jgi:hypothetical protein
MVHELQGLNLALQKIADISPDQLFYFLRQFAAHLKSIGGGRVVREQKPHHFESIDRYRARRRLILGASGTEHSAAAGTEEVSFRRKLRPATRALVKLWLVAEVA